MELMNNIEMIGIGFHIPPDNPNKYRKYVGGVLIAPTKLQALVVINLRPSKTFVKEHPRCSKYYNFSSDKHKSIIG